MEDMTLYYNVLFDNLGESTMTTNKDAYFLGHVPYPDPPVTPAIDKAGAVPPSDAVQRATRMDKGVPMRMSQAHSLYFDWRDNGPGGAHKKSVEHPTFIEPNTGLRFVHCPIAAEKLHTPFMRVYMLATDAHRLFYGDSHYKCKECHFSCRM